MRISPEDHQRVADAIAAAEAKTSGEIVVVIAHSSSSYADIRFGVAGLLALATPLPLIWFTQLSAQRIYLAQLVVFAVALGVLAIARLRVALAPKAQRRLRAARAANDQFMMRDVSRTRGRTGVLIYLSAAERCALVLPDVGVADRLPQSVWQGAIDRLCAAAGEGRVVEGAIAAVEACGEALAQAFPREADDANERPDTLHVI